jgi:hypothetical protein
VQSGTRRDTLDGSTDGFNDSYSGIDLWNRPIELVESDRAMPIKTSADYPTVMRELMQSKTHLLSNDNAEVEFDGCRRSA